MRVRDQQENTGGGDEDREALMWPIADEEGGADDAMGRCVTVWTDVSVAGGEGDGRG